jgi:hypothetical protein
MAYNGVIDVQAAAVDTEPVTLDEVKLYCIIDTDQDDDVLTDMIKAARDILEKYLNVSFVSRQITALVNNSCGGQELPMGPITGAIVYTNKAGDILTGVDVIGDQYVSVECPTLNYIKAVYTGGYAAEELPSSLKMAIKAQVLFMYEHKGDEADAIYGQIAPEAKQLSVRYRRVFNEFFI